MTRFCIRGTFLVGIFPLHLLQLHENGQDQTLSHAPYCSPHFHYFKSPCVSHFRPVNASLKLPLEQNGTFSFMSPNEKADIFPSLGAIAVGALSGGKTHTEREREREMHSIACEN